ncbi:MAG: hypothetical protein HQL87_13510 [Magnetococcales bacterium]|nr:hypothetical protein [Magnetococcales bacterium]
MAETMIKAASSNLSLPAFRNGSTDGVEQNVGVKKSHDDHAHPLGPNDPKQ